MQEKLREQIKIIKAMYGDEYKYIDFAEYLEMNINSFYNWLNGYYNLGAEREQKLKDIVNDILF